MTDRKIFTVKIVGPFGAPQRVRAGVVVKPTEPYVGELTDEQLKAIKADPMLDLSKGDTSAEDDSNLADAKAQADQIVADAKAKAEAFVKAAEDAAKTVRDDADAYAKETRGKADEASAATKKAAEDAAKASSDANKKPEAPAGDKK